MTVFDRTLEWKTAICQELDLRVSKLEEGDSPPRPIDVDLVAYRMLEERNWCPKRIPDEGDYV